MKVVWNSNLMMPDFSHNIRITLARLKILLLHPDVALSLPCWLSKLPQQYFFNQPILFLHYEESRFHCAHPS